MYYNKQALWDTAHRIREVSRTLLALDDERITEATYNLYYRFSLIKVLGPDASPGQYSKYLNLSDDIFKMMPLFIKLQSTTISLYPEFGEMLQGGFEIRNEDTYAYQAWVTVIVDLIKYDIYTMDTKPVIAAIKRKRSKLRGCYFDDLHHIVQKETGISM